MSRPSDWSPLGMHKDPTPGDPDLVKKAQLHYDKVATAIDTAATKLRQIAGDKEMKSQAVEAFVSKAEQVASDVMRAHERYAETAQALLNYQPALVSAQDKADQALEDAKQAQDDLRAARLAKSTADADLAAATHQAAANPADAPPVDLDTPRNAVNAAQSKISAAQGALDNAIQAAEDARTAWNTAAIAARDKIDGILKSGDLKDTWWDDWGADWAKKIAKWAGGLAAVLGVLALVVGWIPVIGQALAAVLGTAALILSAISLAANLLLALTGKGGWGDVIIDVISLATFGIGRAIAGGSKAAFQGSRALARVNAGNVAQRSGGKLTMRSLLRGHHDVARMHRKAALAQVEASQRVGNISFKAPFVDGWRQLTGLPQQVRDLGSSIGRARNPYWVNRGLDSVADAMRSRDPRQILATVYGNGDALAHLEFAKKVGPLIATGQPFTRANHLVDLGHGLQLTGSSLDLAQGGQFVFGGTEPTSATTLKLSQDAGWHDR